MSKLGALFYPAEGNDGKEISFDSLYIPFIYFEIYMDGIYIDILNERKDMVIMDVGANIGIITQHMLPHAKKIYSIEPSPDHFEALKKNKEFNHWDNVELFNLALADKDGEMTLHKGYQNRTCDSLMVDFKHGGMKVKTMAFDTFMKENKIEQVDFCKFDTEGSEDMILRSDGFKNVCERVKAIEVEFHFKTWPQLRDYMIGLGYSARQYPSNATVILFNRP